MWAVLLNPLQPIFKLQESPIVITNNCYNRVTRGDKHRNILRRQKEAQSNPLIALLVLTILGCSNEQLLHCELPCALYGKTNHLLQCSHAALLANWTYPCTQRALPVWKRVMSNRFLFITDTEALLSTKTFISTSSILTGTGSKVDDTMYTVSWWSLWWWHWLSPSFGCSW